MVIEQPTPCARRPAHWDLDFLVHSPATATQSLVACLSCPALRACRQDLTESSITPRGLIWAADAYDDDGDRISAQSLVAYLRRRPKHARRTVPGAAA